MHNVSKAATAIDTSYKLFSLHRRFLPQHKVAS